MADYSDDHIDKRVVTRSGVEIGSMQEIRDGDMYVAVEPDADAVSQIGWDGTVNRDVHRLPRPACLERHRHHCQAPSVTGSSGLDLEPMGKRNYEPSI
jgi:hypothetical protein